MKSKVIASVVMMLLMLAAVEQASAHPGWHGRGGRGYGWRPRVYYAPPIPRVIVRPPLPVVRVYPGYGYGGYHRQRGCYSRRGYGRRYY